MRRTTNIYTYKGMVQARLMAAGGTVLALAALWLVGLLLRRPSVWAWLAVVVVGLVGAVAIVLVLVNLWRSGLVFEHGIRRKFQAVCQQKGLTDRIKTSKGKERWRYPRMRLMSGSNASFQLSIKPLLGHDVSAWDKVAPAFALAYGATAARVTHDGNGLLTLKVGYQQVAVHEYEHHGTAAAIPLRWRDQLARVEIGKGEGGQAFTVPLLGSHLLIAGATGAGKGSVTWTIILRQLEAIRAGVVKLTGIDPKRLELALGRGCFADYACTPDEMAALLERKHDEMMIRSDALAGKVRKFEPSQETPLELILVDELGYLLALLPDKKQREKCEQMLNALLILGRAVGYSVISSAQDVRKSVIDARDNYPTRIAMRLQSKAAVDMVLGNGMYEAGAKADLLPATEAGAGYAFVVDEASTLPQMLRVSWVSDDAIQSAAASLSAPPARRLSVVT